MTLLCHDISKTFGHRKVLDRVSHSFDLGIHAIQGPNGIGKSTLLSILAGVQPPDSGSVAIDGQDLLKSPLRARQQLAYVPDDCPIYPFMNGRDFLDLVAHAKRTQVDAHTETLVDRLGLREHLFTRFGQMSLGTQKKMLLAAAWIGRPTVVVMDEPSNAVDQATRDVLIEELSALRKTTVVVISSHDADFVRALGAETRSVY
jgi:ABC-2 type transport system ATP-binding protein